MKDLPQTQLPFAASALWKHLSHILVPARTLRRLSRYPDTEPYWGRSATYRFDDPLGEYGVTYAGQDLSVAFAETVLHSQGVWNGLRWNVDLQSIKERFVVTFEREGSNRFQLLTGPEYDPQNLRLVDLTGSALKRLGLNNDLSASDDYAVSMAVSRFIHEQVPFTDGIYYVSRQNNNKAAVALFERSGVEAVKLGPLTEAVELQSLVDEFNVRIYASGTTP